MNEHECKEAEYAARLLRILHTGLGGLDQDVAAALAAARRSALERGHGGRAGRHTSLAAVYDFKYGLAAAALLIVMASTMVMWWSSQRSIMQETGQLDIHLLTGDLPPGAFIDKDFPAWRPSPGLCRP
jgi:hypothetical protein